ncbi:MAG TPA: SDR family oxidoreductase [Acidimicrobiia bacterium]|jgi:3-oxoacyl-[acyl-carrier protein] reductase|nr:SDR family oxidoreductase [Acidimicrobiia bacterium]HEV3450659.1 SDR family oxidoreductase [Acidimicrobiia bacterium]
MGRLEDRVAVITGAGQGIGLAYAERFLQEGAKVVVAEINEDRARSAMQHLDGKGDVEFVRTDISDEQSALDCAAETKQRFGRLDILVNNAALYYDIDNERNDYGYLKRVFDVNLHGAWLMARACAPHMVEQHRGRIINQSSGAAYIYNMTPPGDFHEVAAFTYSQTKWGVVGLTKFLAGQLGQYNITVNCIAPGVTMTEATKKIVPDSIIDMLPMMSAMKRKLDAWDLTGAALFFASDDAELVTGQVLCVDGGACMPA